MRSKAKALGYRESTRERSRERSVRIEGLKQEGGQLFLNVFHKV